MLYSAHTSKLIYVPNMLTIWSVEILCMIDLLSELVLCSMLLINAAGYLVSCDFHAWEIEYGIFATGFPVSVYWKVIWLWMDFWEGQAGSLDLGVCLEFPFGHTISGSLN